MRQTGSFHAVRRLTSSLLDYDFLGAVATDHYVYAFVQIHGMPARYQAAKNLQGIGSVDVDLARFGRRYRDLTGGGGKCIPTVTVGYSLSNRRLIAVCYFNVVDIDAVAALLLEAQAHAARHV